MSMIKKTKLVALVGALGLLTNIYATPLMAFSFGVNATLGGSHMEVAGKEVLRGDANSSTKTSTRNIDTQAALASLGAQVIVGEGWFGEGNGFALGYEHFFGEGKFSGVKTPKSDINTVAGGTVEGQQYAEMIVKNYNTIYLETPGFTPLGLYLKAGWSQVDVQTNEALLTGGSYGDTTSDGTSWGFGFKSNTAGWQTKLEFNHTDWDNISATNTSDDTGTSTVSGTPEAWGGKFSIGYNF